MGGVSCNVSPHGEICAGSFSRLSASIYAAFRQSFRDLSDIFNIAKWAEVAIFPRVYKAFADRLSAIFRRYFRRLSTVFQCVFRASFSESFERLSAGICKYFGKSVDSRTSALYNKNRPETIMESGRFNGKRDWHRNYFISVTLNDFLYTFGENFERISKRILFGIELKYKNDGKNIFVFCLRYGILNIRMSSFSFSRKS